VIAGVDGARKAGRASVLLLIKRGNSPEGFVAVDISNK
jgi:serine protease Do